MRPALEHRRYLDAVLVAFLIATALFVPPFVLVWTASSSPWYVPYLLWLGVIGLTLLVDRLRNRHGL